MNLNRRNHRNKIKINKLVKNTGFKLENNFYSTYQKQVIFSIYLFLSLILFFIFLNFLIV
jgi:hypothetical protein